MEGLAGLNKLTLNNNYGLVAMLARLCALARLEVLNLADCGVRALPEGIGALIVLRKLDFRFNPELATLPARLGRLRSLEELDISYGCPRLAALSDLQKREGLPALLAHLAVQGEAAPAPRVEPS